MSLTMGRWIVLICCGLLMSCRSNSQVVPVVGLPSQGNVEAGDYRNVPCKKEVPEPVTGPLLIDSKYDQTDPTKSRLSGKVSADSKQLQESIAGFTRHLVGFADYYEKAGGDRQQQMALACLHQWLQAWSKAGALESPEATKTGVAVRKWSLAAISSVVIRIDALSGGAYVLTAEQQRWLDRLAQQVLKDYGPRQQPGFKYYNNHDYWAGWAIAATGTVLKRNDFLRWGDDVLRRGLSQVVLVDGGKLGYLPNEVARSRLAANYTHYALVPLVLLFESAHRNGFKISRDEEKRMRALAAFASVIVLDPARVSEVVSESQETVESHKMAWLVPYLSRYPDDRDARALYRSAGGKVDGYSQVGGRLRPLYPNFRDE